VRNPAGPGAAQAALLFLLVITALAAAAGDPDAGWAVDFRGGFGQIEVGGPFAGVEFHDSRPLPARISFYYPVANSIDLSSDYWRRGESRPLRLTIRHQGRVDSIGSAPWNYRYTPCSAEFVRDEPGYRCTISYRFANNLPLLVLQLTLVNTDAKAQQFQMESELACVLRTCQTYAIKKPARIERVLADPSNPASGCITAAAVFDSPETDSALVFLRNAGDLPTAAAADQSIKLQYSRELRHGESWQIIQLIGSCRQREFGGMVTRAAEWRKDTAAFEDAVSRYSTGRFMMELPDADLQQTACWSRGVMAANRHYIDGKIVPMPCPAEYNFFFTHDLLLTDLGAVNFDCDRVKNDLLYVHSLARADSLLPHAYYWRDSSFQTEFCSSDNWNHLWFIILTASYLRHSGDDSTVRLLAQMLHKSLQMMRQNRGADGLMYAWQPDWWDIGHNYGARAYITILMSRALREYAGIGQQLGFPISEISACLAQAGQLEQQLNARLWDEESVFFLNTMADGSVDRHYYAGSLLAAAWKMADSTRTRRLLASAADRLLDRNLGIRIAMPMDFAGLSERYQFLTGEVGGPGLYLNGGVWPHGIVWYALGWLAAAEPDSAGEILRKYLTLEGISRSPHGQPSFFEYRNADPASPRYGEIDKPTFLWTGGWFLHALYQLAGLRENEWNLYLSPRSPEGWNHIVYDAAILGKQTRVTIRGEGNWFRELHGDGKPLASAVMTHPLRTLSLERGMPKRPYLAEASCRIGQVSYVEGQKRLQIEMSGIPGQAVDLQVVSPAAPVGAGRKIKVRRDGSTYETTINIVLKNAVENFDLRFY